MNLEFYSPEGLRAIALYLDELIDSDPPFITQNALAKIAGISSQTIGEIRRNRSNTTEMSYEPKPKTLMAIAPHIPDPRLPQSPSEPTRTFANPEDFLLMARGIIPIKKIQGETRKTDLASWLKDRMIERNLNVSQLAELLGVPAQDVYEVFNGIVPTPLTVARIAEVFASSDTLLIWQLAGVDIHKPLTNGKPKD